MAAKDLSGKRFPDKNVKAFFLVSYQRGKKALIRLMQVCFHENIRILNSAIVSLP
jgi:hypothetical protein